MRRLRQGRGGRSGSRRALDMVRMASVRRRAGRRSSPAASSSASRWPARWCSSRKLVLMDEPLGALDKQLREHMQLEIKHLHARLGINVVYVTHDQGEALTMSDRVGVFNDGIMQQIAPPNELYEAPANPFVAQFIGENNAIGGRGRRAVRQRPLHRWRPTTARSLPRLASDGLSGRHAGHAGAAAGALRAVAGRRTPAQPLQGPRRGAHLLRRSHAPARRSLRLRTTSSSRFRHQRDAPIVRPGAEIDVGWRADDCRALRRPECDRRPTATTAATAGSTEGEEP